MPPVNPKPSYRTWILSEHRRRAKLRAIEYKGGKCSRCGYDSCVAALDFHHTDPSQKDLAIGSSGHLAWETLKSELDKCLLLCANCHREEHDRERQIVLQGQEAYVRTQVPARKKKAH
jgi:predicted HNH restriction endonuclease